MAGRHAVPVQARSWLISSRAMVARVAALCGWPRRNALGLLPTGRAPQTSEVRRGCCSSQGDKIEQAHRRSAHAHRAPAGAQGRPQVRRPLRACAVEVPRHPDASRWGLVPPELPFVERLDVRPQGDAVGEGAPLSAGAHAAVRRRTRQPTRHRLGGPEVSRSLRSDPCRRHFRGRCHRRCYGRCRVPGRWRWRGTGSETPAPPRTSASSRSVSWWALSSARCP
jgi:hypothetical protein